MIDLASVPDSIREAAEDAADAAGITDPILREAAILDYIFTGNPSFLSGASGVQDEADGATEGLDIEDAPEIPLAVAVGKTQTSVTEGDSGTTSVVFTFYRSGPADEAITIDYAISGVDAADLADGTALTGTILLDAEATEVNLEIQVKGDLTTEADEVLTVAITGTTLGVVGAASAQTTILTDDFAPIAEDDDFNVGLDGTVSDSLFGINGGVLADRDPDGDAIRVVAVNGTPVGDTPLELLLNYGSVTISTTGSISYATDERADGLEPGEVVTETFEYQIDDGQGGFDTATASITVQGAPPPANTAPVAEDDTVETAEDTELPVDLSTMSDDPDGNIAGWAVGDITGGTFQDFNEDTGQFTFIPDADFNGDATFAWTVFDADGESAEGTLTIRVTPVNDAPDVVPLEAEFTEDDTGRTVQLLDGASDVEDDDLDVSDLVLTAEDGRTVGFTLDADTGLLTLEDGGFEDLSEGETVNLTAEFLVSDGQVDEANSATITITGANDAPVAGEDEAFTTHLAIPFSAQASLLANDSDEDGDTITVTDFDTTGSSGGTLFVRTDGFFSYTPVAGFTGEESFFYTISDSFGATDTATVTFTVTNEAPVAGEDEATVGTGGNVLVDVLSNDSDPDGDGFAITNFTDAANGEVSLGANGQFSYSPDAGFSGNDSFTYTIEDTFGATATATVSIVVEPDEFEFNEVLATPNQPFLRGGAGADALIFNTTRSTQAFGGAGADVFVFDLSNDGKRDVGYIRDFEQGVDLLDLGGTAFALRHIGPNTVISMAGADRDTLTISGVNLTESDFTTVWTSRDDGSMI